MTGALLYAFDSDIRYTQIATECAIRLKKFLNIPVSIVTDKELNNSVFDQEIVVDKPGTKNFKYWQDTDQTSAWYNAGRSGAFEVTPYDRTLLVDIDYMVNSGVLKSLLDSHQSFFAHKTIMPVTKQVKTETFGQHKTTMWWATVVIFDRSEFTQDVFAIWKMVESNYQHYANVFQFDARKFRNDYALSIALLVANGNTIPEHCEIPWPLVNVDPDIAVDVAEQKWTIDNKFYTINQDLHVMGKSYLEKLYAI
tara:strand:+ start:174 stop:932 length:759 start_codon:yes stop_codon:yes gene_type:complete